MTYTNSPLVTYTKISPNQSGERTHSIDRITPHCVVGQCTAESLGALFADPERQASVARKHEAEIQVLKEKADRSSQAEQRVQQLEQVVQDILEERSGNE